MAFHDTRLPVEVERGAAGGPEFKTTILELSSGHEKRNIDWRFARGMWDLSYGIMDRADYEEVLDFFYARRGRAHSFRFKDWSDYELDRQVIAQTDGATTTFQIIKTYGTAPDTYDRELTKPVTGTVQVWVNSSPITQGGGSSQFQVDLLTGIITLGSTLAAQNATDIEVACQFDVPVRFESDSLAVQLEWSEAGSIPAINVVEVRVD